MVLRLKALLPATLLAGAVALAACSTPKPMEGAGGKLRPNVPGLIISSRVVGRDAAYVEVTALHRSRYNRLVRIALVGPDGKETNAEQLRNDVLTGRRYGYPSGPFGSIGIGGGSGGRVGFGLGLGIAFPLGISRGYSRTAYRTRATIKVPAPGAYRRDPSRWKIKLVFDHAKQGRHDVIQGAPLPGA
jgi:predicted small secreted protein